MSDVTRYWVLNRLPLGVKEDVQALGYKKMVDSADYDAMKARAEAAEQQVQSYRDSLDQVQRWRLEEKDGLKIKLAQAQDTVTRLREALERIILVTADKPALRPIALEAHAALSATEAGPKKGA
jgi:hypothetical protein